ncbi:MAG TPA: hypothetical protein PLL26_06740 [Candidatus Dojkabacteria bacterium]|nr:hypothetical protein [Candidatus Dojkabacteria bacterium]
MISISYLFEEDIIDQLKREVSPEEKLLKSNSRKNLAIAGLLGGISGMGLSQLIHQIKDK